MIFLDTSSAIHILNGNESLKNVIDKFGTKELTFIGIIFGGVSLLISLLYWNFRVLKITLTKNQLEVDYGIFNHKKIPLQKIMNHIFNGERYILIKLIFLKSGFIYNLRYCIHRDEDSISSN